jgi:hypothetical protein
MVRDRRADRAADSERPCGHSSSASTHDAQMAMAPRFWLLAQMHASSGREHEFCRVRQVLQVHRFHRVRKRLVLNRDIQFPVADPARKIEVR